jgi:conjugal transfer pilus assembly protein TraV
MKRILSRAKISVTVLAFISLLSGCAIFNPYSSSFECPHAEPGKCQSMPDAYREVVGGVSSPSPTSEKGRVSSPSTAKNDYDAALYGKLRGLITSPASPIVAPPQVLRVLILPYQDDKKLLLCRSECH